MRAPAAPLALGLLLAAAAILLRLVAATNGLPLPLASDEEVMLGGALRILETRNPIPTLSPILAETLYYPPLLAWLYAATTVPVAAYLWWTTGFGSVADLGLALSFAPETYWYAARATSVAFGVGAVFVVYRLARELGLGTSAALVAAALVAFDPTHLMMGATARHWAATFFFLWATHWMALRVFDRGRLADYRWAALFGALGFGTSYIGALGLIALAVAHLARAVRARRAAALFDRAALETILIAGVLTALFALAHLPAITRLVGGGAILPLATPKSFAGFAENLWFYTRAYLWSNPVLVVGGLAALGAALSVFRGRRGVVAFGVGFGIFYMVFLYRLMPTEERYALPVVGLLALGLACIVDRIEATRLRGVVLGLVLVYPLASSAQLVRLMAAPDTRLQAKRWIEANVAAPDGVGIHMPGVWFRNTAEAVAAIAQIDPGALRNRDRQIAALGARTPAFSLPPAIAYVDLDQIKPETWAKAGSDPVSFMRAQGWRTVAIGTLRSWVPPAWYARLEQCARLVVAFEGSPPTAPSELDMRRTLIFREGSWTWFARDSFGPRVEIWTLQAAAEAPGACGEESGL
jgi:hypothetical protein